MQLPKRKPNRLTEYAYDTPNAYFITVCTKDRRNILCDIVGDDAHIVPKAYGKVAQKYLSHIIGLDKYVIMPNHIHMLLRIDGTMKASSPTQSISTIVRSFKTMVTKEIGEAIFQRSFHDHVVRGQRDYDEIWEYIENNPKKWQLDRLYQP